ncbi:hypothetical protein HDV00_005904 [Rhizophlyctis rosea]|nr:hypothetical protein HDV00_005904 [Rhizophlyctis rosea]
MQTVNVEDLRELVRRWDPNADKLDKQELIPALVQIWANTPFPLSTATGSRQQPVVAPVTASAPSTVSSIARPAKKSRSKSTKGEKGDAVTTPTAEKRPESSTYERGSMDETVNADTSSTKRVKGITCQGMESERKEDEQSVTKLPPTKRTKKSSVRRKPEDANVIAETSTRGGAQPSRSKGMKGQRTEDEQVVVKSPVIKRHESSVDSEESKDAEAAAKPPTRKPAKRRSGNGMGGDRIGEVHVVGESKPSKDSTIEEGSKDAEAATTTLVGKSPRKKEKRRGLVDGPQNIVEAVAVRDQEWLTSSTKLMAKSGGMNRTSKERYMEHLQSMTVEKLKGKCWRFGLSSPDRKGELVSTISDHISLIATHSTPKTILAIDMGLTHLAFARITTETPPKLLQWQLILPKLPKTYKPDLYAKECAALLDEHVFQMPADVCIVERNYWGRNEGKIPDYILRLRSFEAAFVSVMTDRARKTGTKVESVLPQLVSAHYGLKKRALAQNAEMGKETKYDHGVKKRMAVEIASEWMEQRVKVECADSTREGFNKVRKRDDLADALLLAVAWNDWWHAARAEAEEWCR